MSEANAKYLYDQGVLANVDDCFVIGYNLAKIGGQQFQMFSLYRFLYEDIVEKTGQRNLDAIVGTMRTGYSGKYEKSDDLKSAGYRAYLDLLEKNSHGKGRKRLEEF